MEPVARNQLLAFGNNNVGRELNGEIQPCMVHRLLQHHSRHDGANGPGEAKKHWLCLFQLWRPVSGYKKAKAVKAETNS
jgi:hypothetical protein